MRKVGSNSTSVDKKAQHSSEIVNIPLRCNSHHYQVHEIGRPSPLTMCLASQSEFTHNSLLSKAFWSWDRSQTRHMRLFILIIPQNFTWIWSGFYDSMQGGGQFEQGNFKRVETLKTAAKHGQVDIVKFLNIHPDWYRKKQSTVQQKNLWLENLNFCLSFIMLVRHQDCLQTFRQRNFNKTPHPVRNARTDSLWQ